MITLDIDIPEGFEATGEYRPPNKGDWYINDYDSFEPILASGSHYANYIILRKKVNRWRADPRQEYWRIGKGITACFLDKDLLLEMDNCRYEAGNYFRLKEHAIEALRRIIKVLEEYHVEIGE